MTPIALSHSCVGDSYILTTKSGDTRLRPTDILIMAKNKSHSDDRTAAKSRLVSHVLALALGITLLSMASKAYFAGYVAFFDPLALICGASFATMLALVRRGGRADQIVAAMCIISCFALPVGYFRTGGIESPVLVFYPMVPLVVIFFFGIKPGWWCAGSCVATLAICYFLEKTNMVPVVHFGSAETGPMTLGYITVAMIFVTRLAAMIELSEQAARQILSSQSQFAALGHMAGGMSHEINNPLTVIVGLVHVLRHRAAAGTLDPGDLARHFDRIEINCNRIAKIVTGLREFSRDTTADPLRAVPVKDIIDAVLILCSTRFEDAGIRLEIAIAAKLVVKCRGVQLQQVLFNLMNNAFDAVQPLTDKWVLLSAVEREGRVRITVTDSGAGISNAIRERIMQPFFSTKPVGAGTGLGLSVSKGLVESHDGELWVEHEARNTTFVVELPSVVDETQNKLVA